ncbi:DNA-3-methyladenine glycosylase II [Fistulifera solaris]|uniref:DNA-3-methyladenine glycosylase II n=1 Tax=Fistulifera solaris TaxID=1519565 RepID=A0A1Z5K5F1_FISSO|nr:DNA-3-methyladenine glycosylase II [Fistulifera solaris]|eukprot:GAX21454.1 DNA-3-methyladenine glycosylase II [Fistulifera solaris]
MTTLTAVLETIGTIARAKGGWCLREGLLHLAQVEDGKMLPLILQHGVPAFYSCVATEKNRCRHEATQNLKDPVTCFESLCRTIAGQFVSGFSAQAAWNRLMETTSNNLTPEHVLSLISDEDSTRINPELLETKLRKPAGLTKAKAASIVDLALHFQEGKLSEQFLKTTIDETEIRKALLQVKGIGPWSCDMFLIFFLERPDVLPIGDLGVRKGIAKYFALSGSLKKNQLCPRQDERKITERLLHYKPYFSLLAYYMWRAADTPLLETYKIESQLKLEPCLTVSESAGDPAQSGVPSLKRKVTKVASPTTPLQSKRTRRLVTP